MEINLDNILDPDTGYSEATEVEDALASYVRTAFVDAENFRRTSGVEARLIRALRARRYEYNPEDKSLLGGIDIYMGLTALKCRAAESWINDILLSSIDKPWTINPTPIPNLPEWLREQIIDALEDELKQFGASLDVRGRAKELKTAALKFAAQKAQDATNGMELLIDDQLTEGGWREAFGEFISDLCTFSVAALRSPVIQKKVRLAWDGNKVEEKEEIFYTTRRISPFDFYPSQDSTDSQNGQYVIERMQLQSDILYSMLGLDGFNDEAIRECIANYSDSGFKENLTQDYIRAYLEDRPITNTNTKTIDTLIYNGKVPGNLLIDNNVLVPDAQAFYEAEVWTINNQTIKAVLNPYPLQARPIYSTSFVKIPGSLTGEGMADLLDSVQRMVNSCSRAVVRNMMYSSGPIGEVDVGRLMDGEKPDEIVPYRLYHVDSDPMFSGKPAFNFTVVPSVSPQLMDIMDRFMKMADDLSGVPAYVLGNPQVAGAGRTLGGLSMMMGNAAKGIKNVILNVDRDVIEPLVTFYYNMNMVNSKDQEIKADAQIVARGSTGLLQRELSQARMVELLQTYLPYVQMGLISREGAQMMVRESMKATGMPVDDIIPDPNRVNQLQEGLGRLGVANALETGTSTSPQLDGRSQPPPFPQQSIPPGIPPMNNMPNMNPFPMPANLPQGA